jgi:protein-tyrosine phosphatase
MNRIEPYALWIGHEREGHDFAGLFDQGIAAVVDLAYEEAPRATPRELIACRFPLVDGAGNQPELLALAVRTVAGLVSAGVPTLVFCDFGVSRSPAVVAAALALLHSDTPEACLKRVTAHHPVDVAPRLWAELLDALPRAARLGEPGREQV